MKATLNLVLTHEYVNLDSNQRKSMNHRERHTIPKEMIPIIGEPYMDAYGNEKIGPMELRKLDEFISQNFSDGYGIRNDSRYKAKIDSYLAANQALIDTFSKNKNGSLVIVFSDENGQPRKMRVLYANRAAKTDPKRVFKEIRRFLENADAPTVRNIAEYYDFMFGLEYDKREIYSDMASPLAYYARPIRQALDAMKHNRSSINGKKPKDVAVTWMCKRINDLLKSQEEADRDLGYYYVRLLDAHLAKKYEYETTPIEPLRKAKKTKTSAGTITTRSVSKKTVKLVKQSKEGTMAPETDYEQLSFDQVPEPIVIPDDALERPPQTETMEEMLRPEWYAAPTPEPETVIQDREDAVDSTRQLTLEDMRRYGREYDTYFGNKK